MTQHFIFHRVNTFSCAGNVAAVPGAGATGPDHQGRASSPSFTLPIHRPIHRAHCWKDLRDGREKTIQKEEVREVWLGCLEEEKKLRTQQSLVSICAMLCWDPWPCLGHVRIVNQSGAGWNNIGVGRNHKEGNHGIPWQNISLCFYWDLGTSWQAGGNSSWTRAVRTSRGLDCSQEGDRFVGSVVVSTSNRHRKNVLSRIEQLNIAGRAMKVQWKFNGSLRTFSTFLCGNTCFMIR